MMNCEPLSSYYVKKHAAWDLTGLLFIEHRESLPKGALSNVT